MQSPARPGARRGLRAPTLTRDDEDLFQEALALFNRDTVHMPDTVRLETEWACVSPVEGEKRAERRGFLEHLYGWR